jgi:hypothetical protein
MFIEVKQPKAQELATINGRSAEYYLFHATRINNIIMGQQTPMNRERMDGTTDCGCYIVDINDNDEVVTEVIDSLLEMGHLDSDTHERLCNIVSAQNKGAEKGLSSLFD